MKTVRVKIANGYRPVINTYIEENPGYTQAESVLRWVEYRYGGWIMTNIEAAEFSFSRVDPQGFDIRFESDEAAKQFQNALGGQVVDNG